MELAGFNYSQLGEYNTTNGRYSSNFFNMTMLSLNSCCAGFQWVAGFVEELPKIGIGVKEHVSTGWENIIPRTFGSDTNPPSYDDGGFDILNVGYSWSLDWNPGKLYDKDGFCSMKKEWICSNFMNYANQTVADLIDDYLSELDFDTRLQKVKLVQQALYDDIPVIPVFYPQSLWGLSSELSGIDLNLLSVSVAEWDEIAMSNWIATPEGEQFALKPGITEPSSSTNSMTSLTNSSTNTSSSINFYSENAPVNTDNLSFLLTSQIFILICLRVYRRNSRD